MIVKTFINHIILNHKKVITIALNLGELAFSLCFFSKLKISTEPISKNHGPILRYALIAINNRLYNYEFGRNTNIIKYVYSLVFLPSLLTHALDIQSIYSVIQACSIIFELLCMTDLLNTTQSMVTYNMLIIVKISRIGDIIIQLFYALKQPLIKRKSIKLEKVVQKDSKITKPKIIVTESESEIMTRRPSELEQDLSKLNEQHLSYCSSNKNHDSTDNSVGSQLPPIQITPVQPQKKIQQQKQTSFPTIKMKVTTQQGQYTVYLKDPYQFDQVFCEMEGINELDLLHIKLNYCTQVYRIIKNHSKGELKLHAFYVRLMTEYTAAMMLVNA